MTEILNGKILAKTIRDKARIKVEALNHPPGLAVILVGENPASQLYVGLKETAAKEVGIYVERFEFEANATTEEILECMHKLNARKEINGILLQLPLPGGQDTDAIIAAIEPTKDIDGFHAENRRRLQASNPILVPPTALSVMRLLQATRLPLNGKTAVIVGNSPIFAEPIIELMREAGITATFVAKNTEALEHSSDRRRLPTFPCSRHGKALRRRDRRWHYQSQRQNPRRRLSQPHGPHRFPLPRPRRRRPPHCGISLAERN
jgi:methylenetetrahydrofolate dehydrogenase (NADP+) / methenyltetrahydrofolate cyclohydrolase